MKYKEKQKTGGGWNIWLLVITYCGRKKKSLESTREMMLMTPEGAVVKGPLADCTLESWLHSWHCLKSCRLGRLTTTQVGRLKLREVNAMPTSRQLTRTRTRMQGQEALTNSYRHYVQESLANCLR